MEQTKHKGIYSTWQDKNNLLLTKSLTGKQSRFKEDTIDEDGTVYRVWDPTRSKLGAAIAKKLRYLPIRPGITVLYLGAANGYTPSFVSDILGEKELLIALDHTAWVVRDLFLLTEKRSNMIALLEDARKPSQYAKKLPKVDCIYQDVAQRDQTEIFMKNADSLLKPRGYGILCIKARSIDVTKNPHEVYQTERSKLMKKFEVISMLNLNPYEKDHSFIICRKLK